MSAVKVLDFVARELEGRILTVCKRCGYATWISA